MLASTEVSEGRRGKWCVEDGVGCFERMCCGCAGVCVRDGHANMYVCKCVGGVGIETGAAHTYTSLLTSLPTYSLTLTHAHPPAHAYVYHSNQIQIWVPPGTWFDLTFGQLISAPAQGTTIVRDWVRISSFSWPCMQSHARSLSIHAC